jgi:hypothetical protein
VPDPQPILLIATLCGQVIEEADGGLTLFRLVDGASGSKAPTANEPIRASFPLFVKMLRNGFVGEKTLFVTCRDPESEDDPQGVGEARLVFGDDPHLMFVIAIVNIDFACAELGDFWFDVFLGDDLLVSLPFEVRGPQSGTQTD